MGMLGGVQSMPSFQTVLNRVLFYRIAPNIYFGAIFQVRRIVRSGRPAPQTEQGWNAKAAFTAQANIAPCETPPGNQPHHSAYPDQGKQPCQVETGESIAALEIGVRKDPGNCSQILVEG